MDCGICSDGDVREVQRRYRTLVEHLPLVVYVDALDAESSNIFTSRQIEPMLGYPVEEWLDDPMLFVRALHHEDRDRVLAAHARTHATHEPLSIEYRLIARDGSIVWIRDEGVVVYDDEGQPLNLQGYLLDITAQRDAEEQLRRQALYDPLTGLANRVFFQEQLEQATSVRKENGEESALLFVDLNDFKEINDQWGHTVGDAVLEVLGRRIKQLIRAGDSAARLGGDEFAVVLASVAEPDVAARVAERLVASIAEPIEIDGRQLGVQASVGIALGYDPRSLLKEADAAMYRAKSQPELDYAFFDAALDDAALKRSRRLAELRRAVDAGEFTLNYQPVVDLEEAEVVGYEALLRWQHPTRGEVLPLEFITLAEESGLIVPIGRWVLMEACLHGSRLRAMHGRDIEMAVNVSARQLQHPEFVEHVDAALARAALPPSCLTLELTESVLVAAGDRVELQLAALKRRGIKLALDDFGTGYASLGYLQRLPVDIVKIDRSFTARIDSTSSDVVLLRGIIGLGTALGLHLVAEGIETSVQHGIVRELGCHGAQGFYFGRPAPADLGIVAVPAS